MPVSESNPYGYDPDTDTVRVSRRDLARLLMQFRAEIEREDRFSQWFHMAEHDEHLERLADAVEYGSAWIQGTYDQGPRYQLRCKRTPAYVWPAHPPYDGGHVEVIWVRAPSFDGARDMSHYAYWEGPRIGRALCGVTFSRENAAYPAVDEPDCWECLREGLLATDAVDDGGQWQ